MDKNEADVLFQDIISKQMVDNIIGQLDSNIKLQKYTEEYPLIRYVKYDNNIVFRIFSFLYFENLILLNQFEKVVPGLIQNLKTKQIAIQVCNVSSLPEDLSAQCSNIEGILSESLELLLQFYKQSDQIQEIVEYFIDLVNSKPLLDDAFILLMRYQFQQEILKSKESQQLKEFEIGQIKNFSSTQSDYIVNLICKTNSSALTVIDLDEEQVNIQEYLIKENLSSNYGIIKGKQYSGVCYSKRFFDKFQILSLEGNENQQPISENKQILHPDENGKNSSQNLQYQQQQQSKQQKDVPYQQQEELYYQLNQQYQQQQLQQQQLQQQYQLQQKQQQQLQQEYQQKYQQQQQLQEKQQYQGEDLSSKYKLNSNSKELQNYQSKEIAILSQENQSLKKEIELQQAQYAKLIQILKEKEDIIQKKSKDLNNQENQITQLQENANQSNLIMKGCMICQQKVDIDPKYKLCQDCKTGFVKLIKCFNCGKNYLQNPITNVLDNQVTIICQSCQIQAKNQNPQQQQKFYYTQQYFLQKQSPQGNLQIQPKANKIYQTQQNIQLNPQPHKNGTISSYATINKQNNYKYGQQKNSTRNQNRKK